MKKNKLFYWVAGGLIIWWMMRKKKPTNVVKMAETQAATEASKLTFVPDMTSDKELYQQDLKNCK